MASWNSAPRSRRSIRSSQNCKCSAGLTTRTPLPGNDGAGDHARGGSVLLTGVRLNKSATELRAGESIDQAIARRVGSQTRFSSLELTCDDVRKSGACDSGYSCAYQFNVSWRDAATPMTPEASPRAAFERLFGAGGHGERRQNFARRQAEQRSLLDFVRDDASAFQKKLSSGDRVKLDQYLTSVRDIERRIAATEKFGESPDPTAATPKSEPGSDRNRIELMFEVLAIAFETDSTRVATLMLAHDGSNRTFDELGLTAGHHDLTHHQNREDWIANVAQIDQWYVERFAWFLDRLDKTRDLDGRTLLDNSMIVYASGNADANRHSHENLPVILAGGGGGALHPGRFVQHGAKPMTNLFLKMAETMGGKELVRLGDSTGVLADV